MLNPKFIKVTLLLCCVFASCIPPTMSSECREFFAHPLDQRGQVLSTYPLDKQLRIYRCGLNRRPPDRYLARLIADGGEAHIPVLLERLETEKDEQSQYGVIEIFEAMSVKGYFRNRPDAIERIRKVVAKMKIPTFQQMAQEDLERIEKNSTS